MDNPELQKHLAALDAELEEGDITQKGYEKHRTLLLSRFGVNVGPGSTTSSNPSHYSLQQWRYSGASYQGTDSSPVGGRSQASLAMGGTPQPDRSRGGTEYEPAQAGTKSSYLQSAAPPHMRSSSNSSSRLSPHSPHSSHARGESMTLPIQGPLIRNYSSASSNPSVQQQQSYSFTPPHNQTQLPPQIEYEQYDEGQTPMQDQPGPSDSRSNTLFDAGGYFSDFTAQAYEPGRDPSQNRPLENDCTQPLMHRYSAAESAGFSPTAAVPPPMLNTSDMPSPNVTNTLMPLEPRDVPFAVDDPHNKNIPMSKFDDIATVLRHRARSIPKQQAYVILDTKGKEVAAISWEKLGSRAEKVAQVIREKSGLYRGDRVALIYRDVELIDFAVALLGCFIAGVVAVPINNMEDYPKLNFILTSTQAHLALTTDSNLKTFQRELTTQKLAWPRGVEWWKTNEFGSFHAKKGEEVPPLQVPDLAYIEFWRAPTGDLRGVVLSHRTIMHQMGTLSAIINTAPTNSQDTFDASLRDKTGRPVVGGPAGETLVTYLDPRQGIGLIHSVLMTVYGGQTTVWCSQTTTTVAGLYANIITRYKATLCLGDYPTLKLVAYNYQTEPFATRNFQKKYPVDFSSIKLMMIDALVVDSEFHEILADRWLKPLGNRRARDAVAPMLCLPEHGGMVIVMRDWVGGEERMGFPLTKPPQEDESIEPESPIDPKTNTLGNGYSSLLSNPKFPSTKEKKPPEIMEVLLDREALKTNDVVVVAMGEEVERRGEDENALRVGAFGYPIPDATLAIVDPETSLLCSQNSVGEIWVDSPSLSGGFWAAPKQTETIFHARAYRFEENNPHPVPVEPEFLRTGLLGCVIEGKIFVLGLYEDRLRQRVEWVDGEQAEQREEYRYFFVQHLVVTLMKKMSKLYDCSAFDVCVNDEHLPIILLESHAASTAPTAAGGAARQLDIALLDSLSERCMEVLLTEHQLRVYCVMITAPNSLPRVVKNGRREIGNMLCRREFDSGTLPCVHVEFGVERAVRNLPVGIDPVGGIWSYHSTRARQDLLASQEKQYSGVDYRAVVIDDRTSTPLSNFASIADLLQWRVSRQAEELSYCTIDGRGREGKGITWKKLDLKIGAVATQLKNKCRLNAGDHAILIYTHSEDFLFALHACFCLGVIAIPLAPLDSNRLAEDIPAFLHMVADFNVKCVLVNTEVETLLKGKPLAIHLKQSAGVLNVKVPTVHNTAKVPKSSQGCRDLGYTVSPAWFQPGSVALVWTYWTPDQRRISVALGHETIMGICKVMKETCQMTSMRPVIACVRSTSGMGFVMSWLMGIFIGAPTYLISPIDFAQNPMSVFLTLSRYKVKDTYATRQMLEHAISTMPAKGFTLHELRNLMITCEGRPRPDVFQKVRMHFAAAGLDRTAINTIYSHVLNPMIATRSYMNIEPIELWLDPKALRRGLVIPVEPDSMPGTFLVQDSGMVPVQTQVAIVNPETRRLCHTGEYGEIWVVSEACVQSFYNSKDSIDVERFQGKIADGDMTLYVRTGDLGFLHTVSRPIGPGQTLVEMQILFVLGGIGDTIEVNGLQHFPIDIESGIERCHRNIVPSGSACFQAGGLVVILVEVHVKSYLASMVPVIVNTILDQHQLVVDIVAFVSKGDFPRSRLGEKQRGKILASWVTRKMRTIAQFGIRDTHGGGGGMGGIGFGGTGSRPASFLYSPHPHPPSMISERMMETTVVESSKGSTPTPTTDPQPPTLGAVELPAGTTWQRIELPAMNFEEEPDPITPTLRTHAAPQEHSEPPTLVPPPKNPRRRASTTQKSVVSNSSTSEYPTEALLQMKLDEENGADELPGAHGAGWGKAM